MIKVLSGKAGDHGMRAFADEVAVAEDHAWAWFNSRYAEHGSELCPRYALYRAVESPFELALVSFSVEHSVSATSESGVSGVISGSVGCQGGARDPVGSCFGLLVALLVWRYGGRGVSMFFAGDTGQRPVEVLNLRGDPVPPQGRIASPFAVGADEVGSLESDDVWAALRLPRRAPPPKVLLGLLLPGVAERRTRQDKRRQDRTRQDKPRFSRFSSI